MKELLQKIALVAKDCMNIEKDMQVGKGNYAYKAVSDNAVTLKVKKSEESHGIISIAIKQDLISSDIVKVIKPDGKEGVVYNDIVKLTLRIYHIETEKFIDIESFGRGLDSGDKGFGKASTYARKYALLNAYKIATGEDPDANPSNKETVKTINEKHNLVKDYMLKDNKYLSNLLTHFNCTSIDDFTNENLDSIYKQLNSKKLL